MGEIEFADDVDSEMQAAVRGMWVERLAGFRAIDLDRYLSGQCDETRYVTPWMSVSGRGLRRLSRAYFWIRRLGRLIGLDLGADVLDARVTREGALLMTRGRLVLTVGGRVVPESELAFSIRKLPGDSRQESGARLVWHEARVTRRG